MCKKMIGLSILLSSLMLSASSFAQSSLRIGLICPANNMLSNYQDKVIGNGVETIYTSPEQISTIQFNSNTSSQVEDFSSYYSQSVQYSSASGKVTCHFVSSNVANPDIDMSYTLMNGEGGIVVNSSSNSVIIDIPVGVKK
jgi:hypothetical protein